MKLILVRSVCIFHLKEIKFILHNQAEMALEENEPEKFVDRKSRKFCTQSLFGFRYGTKHHYIT
ncbi:MAG: hypothetical protein JXA42_00590, partial [Anaerolineales bacterium]|nr:hypothetical protein [Anaerolineales bacterium]